MAVDVLAATFSEAFRSNTELLLQVGFSPDEAASLVAQNVMQRAWLFARMAALNDGRVPNKQLFVDLAERATSTHLEWRFVDHVTIQKGPSHD